MSSSSEENNNNQGDHNSNNDSFEMADILYVLSTKKKWKSRMCNTSGPLLYIEGKYKKGQTIILPQCDISTVEDTPFMKKDHIIKIVTEEKKEYVFACKNIQALQKWLNSVNHGKNCDYTSDVETTKNTTSTGKKVKKYIGSKVATSAAGKKIIKEMIGKSGIKLLNTIKDIISTFYKDEKKGKEVEEDIIRFAVKAILLHRDSDIKEDDVLTLKPYLRELWNTILDYAGVLNFDYEENKNKVIQTSKELIDQLKTLLLPHLTEINYERLGSLYEDIFGKDILDFFFKSSDLVKERQEIVTILEKHYKF